MKRCEECGSWEAECSADEPVPGCGCARCLSADIEMAREVLRRHGTVPADVAGRPIAELVAHLSRSVLRGREVAAQAVADARAVHDALGWAHEWHGKELPPPTRAVSDLLRRHDETLRQLREWQARERVLGAR